jgi:hypothetical protein
MTKDTPTGVQMDLALAHAIRDSMRRIEGHNASMRHALIIGQEIATEIEEKRVAAWKAFFAANPELNPQHHWNLDVETGLVTPVSPPASNEDIQIPDEQPEKRHLDE